MGDAPLGPPPRPLTDEEILAAARAKIAAAKAARGVVAPPPVVQPPVAPGGDIVAQARAKIAAQKQAQIPAPVAPPAAPQQPGFMDRAGSWLRENVFDPSSVPEVAHDVGQTANAMVHAPLAALTGASAQIHQAVAPISDLPFRALGLGTPSSDAAAAEAENAQRYLEQTTAASPVAQGIANAGTGLIPFAINPLFGGAVAGQNTYAGARANGASMPRALLGGAAATALNVAAPYAAKPFAPLISQLGPAVESQMGRIPAALATGAAEGAPQGAAFAAGQPAVNALAGLPQQDPNGAETIGTMAVINALMRGAHALPSAARPAPEAPRAKQTTQNVEAPSAPEPVRPAPEPAAPEPVKPSAPVASEAAYAKSPPTEAEAQKFSVEHANAVAGKPRTLPPGVQLGHEYALPNGETGRAVDYVQGDKPGKINYVFRTPSGDVTLTPAEFLAHESENGPARVPNSYQPVVVKRPNAGNLRSDQGSPAQEAGQEKGPAAQGSENRSGENLQQPPEARPAASDEVQQVAPDEPRPFERQPTGQVAEVQAIAKAGPTAEQKANALRRDQQILDRELAKPPERQNQKLIDRSRANLAAANAPAAKPVAEVPLPDVAPRESAPVENRNPVETPRPEQPRVPEVIRQEVGQGGTHEQSVAPPAHEVKPAAENTQGVEHRAREYGLTKAEAHTVEGRQGANEHPDIPEHVRGAAEFIAGKKHFESRDQWQQWWDSLPQGLKRGVNDITGTEGHDVTSTDEQGHVVAAGQRPVSTPPLRKVRVANQGKKDLEMAVRPLEPDANIGYTAGSDKRGHVETLPRYYVGQITDPAAPPGARGKWAIMEWNPNNDEHFQNKGEQRVPFRDIPTLKAVGGNSKGGLLKSNVYESYTDAKNAALDVVAGTKRNRDFNAAETFGKNTPEAAPREGLTENDKVGAEDIKSGRASFRTREQLTAENPDAVFRPGEGEQYTYDKGVDRLLEKLADKSPEDVAKDPELQNQISGLETLARRNMSRRGSALDPINEILAAVERLAGFVGRKLRDAPGFVAAGLKNLQNRLHQILSKLGGRTTVVAQQYRQQVLQRMAQTALNPSAIRDQLQKLREAGPPRDPVRTRLIAGLRAARAFARGAVSEFRHLDLSKPKDAAFADALRPAMHPDATAQTMAAMAISDATHGISGNAEHSRLFADKFILEDLKQAIDDGLYQDNSVLPFFNKRLADGGLTDLNAEIAKINAEVGQTPAVADAVKKFREVWFDQISGPLAAEGVIPAKLADPERFYFHRQILSHMGDNANKAQETPANVRPMGARPSSFRRRSGAAGEYNPAFEEAMLSAMTQGYKRLIQKNFENYVDSISTHADAIDHNYERNSDAFENDVYDDAPNVKRGFDELGKELNAGLQIPPKYQRYASLLDDLKNGLDVTNHPERSQFLGDVARSRDYLAQKLIRHTLDNTFIEPNDVAKSAGEGEVPVLLDDNHTYHAVKTVPEDLANQIQQQGSMLLQAKNIGDALALGASKPARLVQERFAKQMGESLAQKTGRNPLKAATSTLARWILKNPLSLGAYVGLNATSNATMSFITNPLAFRKGPEAIKLLTKLHYGGKFTPAEQTVMDKLVKNRVIEQHFAGQFDEQAKAALGRLARHSGRAGFSANSWMERAKWLTSLYNNKLARPSIAMVDDIPKVAEFLHQQDVESGAFSKTANSVFGQKFGAARRSQVEAAGSPEERSAVHARAFGDYGALSPLGEAARNSIFPYYSWVEVEAKWIGNLLRNSTVGQTTSPRAAVTNIVKNSPELAKLALKIAAIHFGISQFNNLHSDDTKKKAREAGIDPMNNLILGQTDDGRVRYLPAPAVTSDFMRRVGLGDWYNKFQNLSGDSSTLTIGDVMRQAPKVALMQQMASATPLLTVPLAMATGVRPNGATGGLSAVQPGQAWKLALSGLGARAAVNMFDDQPHPKFSLSDLISRADSPEDQTYYKARQLVADWQRKQAPNDFAPPGADQRSISAQALHDMKAAIKLKDYDAAGQALNSYYYALSGDTGHDPKQVKESIAAMAPDHALGGKAAQFTASLTPTEKETWDKANSDFRAWSDPYKNPDLVRVLDASAGASQEKFHAQTKLYADEIQQRFQRLKGQLAKSGTEQAAAAKELSDTMEEGIRAQTFEKLDAAATKLQGLLNRADPTRASDTADQVSRLREAAREAFAPARPVSAPAPQPAQSHTH